MLEDAIIDQNRFISNLFYIRSYQIFLSDYFFSVVHNANPTAKNLNNDLVKINRWAYQWKMIFNTDSSKQA